MTRRIAVALATVYIVWGSTFLAIKVAIASIPPLLMAGARFVLAGLLLGAVVAPRVTVRPTARQWRNATVTGALLLAVGNGAVTVAEEWIDSGVAALLVACVPFWMTLLGRVVEGERLPATGVVGLVLGVIGVGVLVGADASGVALVPALTIIVGTAGWAYGSLLSRRVDLPDAQLLTVAMQMTTGGLVALALGMLRGEVANLDLGAVTGPSLLSLLYLAVVGSLVAYSAYGYLLRNATMSLTGTYAFVNPIIAVVLGALFLGERIGVRTVVAGAIIVAAVALIVASRRPAAAPRVALAEPVPDAA